MVYDILDGDTVVNIILADADFMTAQYPAGNYRLTPNREENGNVEVANAD